MKKKLIFPLTLVLALLLSMPTMAATVCKIGSKGYSSLQAAVNAVKDGQTIKVTTAIRTKKALTLPDLQEKPNAAKKFTIDFTNKKYTYIGYEQVMVFGQAPNLPLRTVILKNMNIDSVEGPVIANVKVFVQSGTYTGSHWNVKQGGILSINGGTFNNLSNGNWTNAGKVTINKGTFKKCQFINEGKITATSPLLAFEGISRLNGGSFEIESLGLEPNTLSVEAAASEISVSRHNLQNAEQVIQGSEILTVMDAAGAIEYKIGNIYKVKDGNPEQVSSSSFTINAQNGDLIAAKGLGEGSYEMAICITASGDDSHMEGRKVVSIRVDVEEEKLPNPLMVAAKSPSVKASKLKNASITISGKKCFDIQDRKGRLKFTRVSGSEQLSIRRNGAIRVKKGTKKGTYTICVEITAAGNRKYLPATETVEVVVNVK